MTLHLSLAFALVLALLTGCTTEGFKASLDRGSIGKPVPAAPAAVPALPGFPTVPSSTSL